MEHLHQEPLFRSDGHRNSVLFKRLHRPGGNHADLSKPGTERQPQAFPTRKMLKINQDTNAER